MLKAKIPTPIFNTPDHPFFRLPLKKDDQMLIREVETIALPGTPFDVVKEVGEQMVEVTSPTYPSSIPLYVDVRFLEPATEVKAKQLPSRETILERLKEALGSRYFWGGSWRVGIPEMLKFYPHLQNSSLEDRDDAICKGVDCSGLLYQAADGLTPRNTAELVSFGEEVSFDQLEPLDLIVWKGHVLIVLERGILIESRAGFGVVTSSLEKRYDEVAIKKPYLRRWYCQAPSSGSLSLTTT
jgi:cell wall-associated NlpC family hydrolase